VVIGERNVAFDFEKFLDVADELASNGLTEADFRAAVGRAFYGAWNQVRALYDQLGGPPYKDGRPIKRSEIGIRFKEDLHPSLNSIGADVLLLLSWRTQADYFADSTDFEFNQVEAKGAVERARHVIEHLKIITNKLPSL